MLLHLSALMVLIGIDAGTIFSRGVELAG